MPMQLTVYTDVGIEVLVGNIVKLKCDGKEEPDTWVVTDMKSTHTGIWIQINSDESVWVPELWYQSNMYEVVVKENM